MFARFCILATAAATLTLVAMPAARADEPGYGPNTYERTLQALAAHEKVASQGGWPRTPASVTALKPDAQGRYVVASTYRVSQHDLEGRVAKGYWLPV